MSEEAQQQPVIDEKPKASICPCCGKPTLPYPVQHVPDELMDQYMVCLMSGTPFSRTYKMYNERIQITVTQWTAEIRDNVERLLRAIDLLADAGVVPDGVSWDNFRGVVRVLAGILKISIKAGDTVKTYAPAELLASLSVKAKDLMAGDREALASFMTDAYAKVTSTDNVSALPPAQLLAVAETHARLLDVLVDAGFDKSFWKGIELV